VKLYIDLWRISKIASIETIYSKQCVTIDHQSHLPPAAYSRSLNPSLASAHLCAPPSVPNLQQIPLSNTSLHMHTTNLSTTCRAMQVFPPKIPLTGADSLPLGQLRSTLPRYRSCPSRASHGVFDSLSSVTSPADANASHSTACILTTMCILQWECLREGQSMNCVVLRGFDCADA
jgi:hypothetical protein